jgi:hypothetical protein
MFRKKETPAAPVQAPQQSLPFVVLTPEHRVDGTIAANPQLYIPNSEQYWSPLKLAPARLTPIDPAAGAPRVMAEFHLQGGSVVALVPQFNFMETKHFAQWAMFSFVRPGTAYVGPYRVEGELLFNGQSLGGPALPVRNARITHQSSAPGFAPLQAPFVLLNTTWLFGYEPAGTAR